MNHFFLAAALPVSGIAPVSTFGLLVTASPLAAEPINFCEGLQIGRVEGLAPLSPQLRRLYGQFRREARYSAAFAVHFTNNMGFHIQNFHDAGGARAAALEGCRLFAQADGCVIYAVTMPASLPMDQSAAAGLSEWAANDFATAYKQNRKPGSYAAFAISGAGHHGYSNAEQTVADAKDTAVAYCNTGVARDMAEIGPETRKFARARSWQNCKVVDVSFTPAD